MAACMYGGFARLQGVPRRIHQFQSAVSPVRLCSWQGDRMCN